MEFAPPSSVTSPQQTLPEPSEEERVRHIEEHYRAGGRYIDATPAHKAALNLLEERGIKKFYYRQHLLKVLYRLTDPPSKELKQQKTAVVPKTAPSVIDDLKEYSPDTGGESGM